MNALFIFFMLFSSFTFLIIVLTIELKIEEILNKYEKIKGKVGFKK